MSQTHTQPADTVGTPGLPILVALLLAIASTISVYAAQLTDKIESPGQRIYRNGVLASGEALQAIVSGDIAVDGRMFTCASCHLRSGLGATEGVIIAPPINGAHLYKALPRGLPWRGSNFPSADNDAWASPPPWFDAGYLRPAYNDETLARAIREGISPDGRVLEAAMPRFQLSDEEMAELISYLKQLSASTSPGVSDTTITFATVISENVPKAQRLAMLAVLDGYVASKNAQPRGQERRAKAGPFYRREEDIAYRRFELLHWELHGGPSSWRAQLEAYYDKQPVFALLSGIAEGTWTPIHEFCEDHQLPALFPITERPVISEHDWYTVYFSRGLAQEAEAAARYLHRHNGEDSTVVQVYRDNIDGSTLARSFSAVWANMGERTATDIIVAPGQTFGAEQLEQLISQERPAAVLLWLDATDIERLERSNIDSPTPVQLMLASGLLGSDLSLVPERLRQAILVTYPYSLPEDAKLGTLALKRWLKIRNLPSRDLRIESKMYFLGWMLSGVIGQLRNDFYRDYLLDVVDMMLDQDYAIAAYPRLSFGPGQRYASKGCYIVRVGSGPDPELIPISDWVVR